MPDETDLEDLQRGTELVKRGFAKMQKGGVIMDVVNEEQARIAEDVGAVAVMALEAVPADIRKRGGVARMADPADVSDIIDSVSIPVMGKSRIGHTAAVKDSCDGAHGLQAARVNRSCAQAERTVHRSYRSATPTPHTPSSPAWPYATPASSRDQAFALGEG
jgi:hypothetical protein